MSHPIKQPGQSHDEHQADMAEWMGCSVEAINKRHDLLHVWLAGALGNRSHAMRQARGETLTPDEQRLADIEEEAVLYVQRYVMHTEKA